MDQRSGPKNAQDVLYPPIEPFDQGHVNMGDGHKVYVEQCGRKDGIPVLVLHGGPGGGCSPTMRRFFDPAVYRVILFDQRGCGRSRPHASVTANTTQDLIRDIEVIRNLLGIDRFILFGGSWGATLALTYALTHPGRVAAMALRGVFLGTRAELDWFYGGGAGLFFPDLWQRFVLAIPEDERGDLIAAYHRRLFSGNAGEETRFARLWASWENALASIHNDGSGHESPSEYARAFARLENHYFQNGCFLERDGWILEEKSRLAEIPTVIVQGRYDMVCPPISAWKLAQGLPRCDLRMVGLSGHALSEPFITAELVKVMDNWRGDLA